MKDFEWKLRFFVLLGVSKFLRSKYVISILFLSDIRTVDSRLPSFLLPGFSTFSFTVLSGPVCCSHSRGGLVELCSVFDLRPCPEVPVIEEH